MDKNLLIERIGLVLPASKKYTQGQKDPSVVFDSRNKLWHLYFTNCTSGQGEIGHLTSLSIEGPWREESSIFLNHVTGSGVAAPAMEFLNGKIFMFIQQEFSRPGGSIISLSSEDGQNFSLENTALYSIPFTSEAGIYDPCVHQIGRKHYILYSAFPYPYISKSGTITEGIHGDIFLAEKDDVLKTWQRKGAIISHEDIPFHNQHEDLNREWGLEGADFAQLPDGTFLVIGVCFLNQGFPGKRQRIFVAISDKIEGPYKILGVLTRPELDWKGKENGHPCINIVNNKIYIHLQVFINDWKIGLLKIDLNDFSTFLRKVKSKKILAFSQT